MKIQEASNILNKLSPDGLQGWLPYCRQIMVQTTMLEVPVSIDKQELDGLSDDKIKELIRSRMVCALIDKLSTLEE